MQLKRCGIFTLFLVWLCTGWTTAQETDETRNPGRPMADQQNELRSLGRPRELGIEIGIMSTGPLNAITDVAGVSVGHTTLRDGDDLRTGVTVIRPHGGNVFQEKVPAAVVVGNGFGKLVGVSQVQELGQLETPIALTNTLSTFAVAAALVRWTLEQPGNDDVRSVNPVVGECNDGYLNDIRAMAVKEEHVRSALAESAGAAVDEGAVGAGTGTRCMGWKGGIGTASRALPGALKAFHVGVLVQTNFNGVLNVAGAPVGRSLGRYYLQSAISQPAASESPDTERGSCVVVVATDAPLDARQLQRLARRALLGLAAVGSPMTHGSGDYAIAFSTHPQLRIAHDSSEAIVDARTLRDDRLSPLFQAVKESVEEAVVNSLFAARTTTGFRGRVVEQIPIPQVLAICRRHGVLKDGFPGER